MQPLLSVIIACRDAESTLAVQLDALVAQRPSFAWEILICDNGSTDGTRALAETYRHRLPLRIVDAAGRPGPAFARNTGAAVAAAPFLAFVDADDEVAPGWAEAMIAALRANPFVAGRFEPTRLNTERAYRTRPLQQATGLQTSPFGPGLPHAGAGNLGISREAFAAAGGFDADMACLEDTDLCWRVQLAGTPLTFACDAVVHVRLRSSLRGMWRQGRNYGAATAELESRYGSAEVPSGAVTDGAPAVSAEPGRGPVGKAAALLRENRNPGRLIWTLGWHVGHRGHRPAATPAPIRAASPQAGRTAA